MLLRGHQVGNSRGCFSCSHTPTEDTGYYGKENSSNHSKATQGDARGDGKTTELLARVLHEGVDIFLSRRDRVVQLEVKRRVGSSHGCQVFDPCLRVSGLPNEEGVHLFLSGRVYVKLLKAKVSLANVYGLIRARVQKGKLKGLTGREVVEPPPLNMLAGKRTGLRGLVEQVM